jgi:DnaJ-class molecular chaperone
MVAGSDRDEIMVKLKPAVREKRCSACGGMGVVKIEQPGVPGRRIYLPQCGECGGKGRITTDDGTV